MGEGIDQSRMSVMVAEEANDLAGFACFLFDQEQDFGTYLHNIYVAKGYQRRGVASGLLAAGIEAFHATRRGEPVHLLVFAKNAPARAFYDRLGGRVIEQIERSRAGSEPVALFRYQWASANKLREASLRQISGSGINRSSG
ncbi:MAG TPA: GNAT family N-acetyltransferase [Devosia sp.]|uniref:GNAT family N-acetyltransferase n=1 Tax=Devosia sp. TaxID=1871048 RepID=UPI002F926E38